MYWLHNRCICLPRYFLFPWNICPGNNRCNRWRWQHLWPTSTFLAGTRHRPHFQRCGFLLPNMVFHTFQHHTICTPDRRRIFLGRIRCSWFFRTHWSNLTGKWCRFWWWKNQPRLGATCIGPGRIGNTTRHRGPMLWRLGKLRTWQSRRTMRWCW